MAVFVSFSDEAETHDQNRVFLISGFVDSEHRWKRFSREWFEEVLNSPKVPYIHMKELRRRDFQRKYGLSAQGAERKVELATKLIARKYPTICGLTSVIKRDDLDEVRGQLRASGRRGHKAALESPDYVAFINYAYVALLRIHERFAEMQRLDFIVSRKHKVSELQKEFHKDLRRYLEESQSELASYVGDLIPADMETRLPLQAADVYCWHKRRFHESRIIDNNCRRLQSIPHCTLHIDRGYLQQLSAGLRSTN